MRVSAGRLWSGLSLASKRLVGAGFALLLTMVGAVTLTMWDLRVVALTDARDNVSRLGIAIAEQTARSVQAVDLILQDLQQRIQRQGIATPAQFSAQLQNAALEEALHRSEQALPQANAFTIIGADGRLVNFSRRWPIPATDLSDRDYYAYFRAHDDPNPFVSQPVRSRGDGNWTVYVVRRVDGPGGIFLGLVLCAIDLNYFQKFYAALASGADTAVTLLKRDGTGLASFPIAARIGAKLPHTSWYHLVAQNTSGILNVPGFFNPGMRLISVHPLTDYPLVVDVSVLQEKVLSHWRRATTLVALGTFSAVLGIGVMLRALLLQLQRLESSESSLAEQNLSLITARRRMEEQARALQDSQTHLAKTSSALKTTLETMSQGIVMVDADRNVVVSNTQAIQLLGLPGEMMSAGYPFDDIIAYQKAQGEFLESPWRGEALEIDLSERLTYQRQRPDGRILEVQSVPLPDGGMVRTYTDITERQASQERISYIAHHDQLTKLVNRVVFQERLEDAIDLADRTGRGLAVLYLDLDRFKLVNDSRGHSVGDQLLAQVADRLRAAVRGIDTVARMGGDEFAIIQPMADHADASLRFADRLLQTISQPFDIEGGQCRVGVSIGLALYPSHAKNADTLLRHADVALYRAKAEGRGIACLFDQDMDARQQALFELEQELRLALDRAQFEIEYQPIRDVATLRLGGFEALLRWRHPSRGTIPPGEFIALAEHSGVITSIGLWVLETACAEAATWPPHLRIAINLSPAQFSHGSLTDELTDILRRTGLLPSRLVLEVTEGLLLDDSSTVLGIMSGLRALGVRFSLDDFGTGYAGLAYLQRFPFQVIKIDKVFVQDMVEKPEVLAIVTALLELSAALSLTVIAEGVETEAQLAALVRLRCPYVQGFLTGRPAPAEQARRVIDADRTAIDQIAH
ncbi:bifunctional diguanylate cyclase/phosphodiesterase [Acidisoma cladoniae]|uniref:bifunctional diguanylate cyclase/phosphodiesterase n=1 Tax=Acidisoma cladoniae TaxID=3040935 RepID=UPI00254EE6FC|nr:EAL domain-containing protein [Acidisoma sp. PAMC 29798]